MVFMAIVPLAFAAFGNYVVPLQIGAPDMAFPRINMASYQAYVVGGLIMFTSFFIPGGPAQAGWTSYSPLATSIPTDGQTFWIIGMVFLITSSLLGAVNFIATIIQLRAPGMTWMRLPFFVWAQFVTSFLLLLAFPPLEAAAVMQLMDKVAHTSFFLPTGLAICGRSQRWRKLCLTDQKIEILDISTEEQAQLSEKITLGKPVKQDSHGCFLRTAEWPNGSRVMFDTHGMLHLKSCDSRVPEVSLVLSAQEVAGWTSDGKVCGPAFFFEGEYASEPALVFNTLQRFLDHL